MAGLSQNVLNMKFMKGADNKGTEPAQPATYKKVKDSSEWFLPNRGQVQQKMKSAVKVNTVGYGSIASIAAEQEPEVEEKPSKKEPEPKKDSKKEADKFLEDISGKSKKDKKRKAEGQSGKPSKKSKKQKKTT
ncbi:hypothetical protein FT663_01990 [Candidozyma haemuli var. vulneris]|uniref:Uncharacterized protein n=1 Tax=Candidozyma haemuli TaxID=45357 RepID=A0A2V1APP4_9ASCO|nr:hypothetical protein CXQ85_001223 [[Candida] haemuloni]KAF3991878.1 hypothetical protein FT662_01495 [[Candida] haemuloni var. vulneris]KAF3993159.1 hypothetical protein FT663_01990 [[Candida] haemuloni var. vulneris]PVH18931.1 hypothetical protein CXQ85_001223 [[Candida] haemuloni]